MNRQVRITIPDILKSRDEELAMALTHSLSDNVVGF